MKILPLLMLTALCAAAAPAPAPLSEKQLAKLVKDIDKNRGSVVPGPELSRALGLPKTKDPYEIKYAARSADTKDGPSRTFSRSKDRGDYIFVLKTKAGVSYFRAGPGLDLAATARYRAGSTDPEAIPEKDAASQFESELAFWAAEADRL